MKKLRKLIPDILRLLSAPGGGGGTPLYGLYRYVRAQRLWFSAVLVINRVLIIAILPPLWSQIGYRFL